MDDGWDEFHLGCILDLKGQLSEWMIGFIGVYFGFKGIGGWVDG